MKICKIYIKGFQQFQDVELDFTNPETGEPLEKICFIGSNGTGKSTVLKWIGWFLSSVMNSKEDFSVFQSESPFANMLDNSKMIFEIIVKGRKFLVVFSRSVGSFIYEISELVEAEIQNIVKTILKTKYHDVEDISELDKFDYLIIAETDSFLFDTIKLKNNEKDLLAYSPAESPYNGYYSIKDVPQTTVNEALDFSKSFPFYALVAPNTINTFWKILVYNLRKRAEERDAYENIPTNLVKTKAQLIKEFDEISPKILDHLNVVWDRILSKAGLYFDVKGANNPFQLNDNLKAYIKLKGLDKTIPYNEISTGIRNFIFRVGHIFSLYFNREIDRAFLLVDEPENSLFPDFLFDLVEIYNEIIIDKRGQNNTQMFFATHNPIIAAQFQPYERIILDWNIDSTVSAKKGVSPVGDDPNDILSNDFELKDLMGPEGRKKWDDYVVLKKKLIRAKNDDEKSELIHEIEKIGSLYNFS